MTSRAWACVPPLLLAAAGCGGPEIQPVDPIACAGEACAGAIEACVENDACYSIDRCVQQCVDTACVDRCAAGHSTEAQSLYGAWAGCFASQCEGAEVRPVFSRADITVCVENTCFGRQNECRKTGCGDLERLVSRCWSAAETGEVASTGTKASCVAESVERYMDQIEDAQPAVTQFETYLECAWRECGAGVFFAE